MKALGYVINRKRLILITLSVVMFIALALILQEARGIDDSGGMGTQDLAREQFAEDENLPWCSDLATAMAAAMKGSPTPIPDSDSNERMLCKPDATPMHFETGETSLEDLPTLRLDPKLVNTPVP